MSRKCPPGVICFENITLVMFFIIASIIIYLAYYRSTSNNDGGTNDNIGNTRNTRNNNDSTNGVIISSMGGGNGGYLDLMPRIGSGYTRGPADVLLNPYTPPLRDDRYINMGFGGGGGGGIPINVPTRSVNSAYRQVGILTRVNGAETILSLMGRPLFPSQDKWQFYTMSDKNQSVKLPVTYKKRSCTSDQGCDNIYNGDTVYVEGYNDAFKATIYDNAIQYSIPYY
jgi:hypothetical protein